MEKYLGFDLGERIREARISAGLTQAQLHDLTQISITQLSNYENGSRNIGIENLAKIAKATKKTIDEIYLGTSAERPLVSSSNDGELIINCITALVEKGIIDFVPVRNEDYPFDHRDYIYKLGIKNYYIVLESYVEKILDFEKNKSNYKDPDYFKEQLMDAAATEINKSINEK